jgi:hypothetical protein
MLLVIVALVIHVPALPQNSIPIAKAAADPGSSVIFPSPVVPPQPASPLALLPTDPSLPMFAPRTFLPLVFPVPKPDYERPSRRLWLTLIIAQHSAATFDGSSTWQAISSDEAKKEIRC